MRAAANRVTTNIVHGQECKFVSQKKNEQAEIKNKNKTASWPAGHYVTNI